MNNTTNNDQNAHLATVVGRALNTAENQLASLATVSIPCHILFARDVAKRALADARAAYLLSIKQARQGYRAEQRASLEAALHICKRVMRDPREHIMWAHDDVLDNP